MMPSPPAGPRRASGALPGAAPASRMQAGFLAWLALITAAAAALRLAHLGIQILGDDELHVLAAVTTRTLAQIPATVRGTDFGIPLALLYRAWAAWLPLDEWTLRAPMLACGILTPALAAGLARRFVSDRIALLFAMLLAVHPLFIFYSRFVRPYALCLVLLLGVLWLLDRWALERRRGPLAGAAACAALACWFQPLAVIAVAFLFLGALLAEWIPRRAPAPGRPLALAAAGVAALLATLALYGPALPELIRQFVVGKVGRGTLDAEVLQRNAAVLTGIPGLPAALLFAAAALAGAVLIARRLGRRSLLLLLPAIGQPLVILALQPESLQSSLVLARYQFYVLPVWLLLAAVALGAFAAALGRVLAGRTLSPASLSAGGPILAALLACGCWLLGPYRAIYTADNAYAHHNVFQTFEFLDSPRWAASQAHVPDAPIHPFYAGLATSPAAAPLVVEWPAPPDYPHDFLYLNQAFHRLPMKLLSTPGEIWWTSPLLELENVLTLREGQPSPFAPGTLVVLHRNPLVELARFVYRRDYWQAPDARHVQASRAMSGALTALLGPPVFEDRYLTVFRQPAD